MLRAKICCIASVAEARLAIEAGAGALGLVSAMPSGPGPIAEALIAEIAAAVPAPIDTFLLTALQDADAIVAQHRRCRTTVLQLVDALPATELRRLRAALPAVSRRIRDAVAVPVWLAGGLGAHNVGAAIAAVRPHGVDLCNGVRSEGRLDAVKLRAFFAALPPAAA